MRVLLYSTLAAICLALAGAQTCQSDTCMNQGVCVIVQGNPSCACPAGVTGDRCEFTGAPTQSCNNTVWDGCSKADVIFMVTHSRYDDRNDIDHEGDYIKALIGELQVDQDHVRVGVVQYHDTVSNVINLDDYVNDKSGLMNRVEELTGSRSQAHLDGRGNPQLSKALAYVKAESFKRARPGVRKIVNVIVHRLGSDYNDYDAIKQTADSLKADCVQLYVTAVDRDRYEQLPYGGQSTSLLQQVASTPTDQYYWKPSSFAELENQAQRWNINCPGN